MPQMMTLTTVIHDYRDEETMEMESRDTPEGLLMSDKEAQTLVVKLNSEYPPSAWSVCRSSQLSCFLS